MIRHVFAPGDEPEVFTANLCGRAGSCDKCPQTQKLPHPEGMTLEPVDVFCICLCHRKTGMVQ